MATRKAAGHAALSLVPALAPVAASDPVPDVQMHGGEPDPREVARHIVLKQLAIAPRSRAQLAQKLTQRGCPADVAEAVLDRMTEVGLVDDEAYAQMLVRSQQSGRGLARRGLARELRTKGIAGDVVDEALASISDEDERERARALVSKKLRAMHGLGIEVQTRRLAGLLARKGYPSSMSYAVIREAIAVATEHQPD
jgi:regulatory protein